MRNKIQLIHRNILFYFGICLTFVLHASEREKADTGVSAFFCEEIKIEEITLQPFLDGLSLDKTWRKLKNYKLLSHCDDKQTIDLQICNNESMLFLKVQYHVNNYNPTHQCWHWNPVIQAYEPGNEVEETLTIVIKDEKTGNSDVWIWRAGRTNPAQKADDLFINEKGELLVDSGRMCWYGRFFGNYAGGLLPRFYIHPPIGSAGDVNAVGVYNGSFLTVELSRKLDTQHEDDVAFVRGHSYGISIFRGSPRLKDITKSVFLKLEFPEK